MKKIFTILLCITFITNVLAQEKDIEKLKQKIEETPYVIEGTVLNVENYPGDNEGKPIDLSIDNVQFDNDGLGYYKQLDGTNAIVYSKATIQVCKTYKGNIQAGTIEIITKREYLTAHYNKEGGHFNNKGGLFYNELITEHPTNEIAISPHQIGYTSFFFLKDFSSIQNSTFNNVYTLTSIYGGITRNVRYEVKEGSRTFYKYAYAGAYSGEWRKILKTKEDFNHFLKQFSSLNTKAPNYCEPTLEKKNVGSNYFLEKKEIDYQQQLNNYNNWLNKNQKRLKENIKQNSKGAKKAEGLILEIDNERLSGASAGPMYLEFDIMAYGTSNSTFLDNCLMRIMYNTSAFGPSLVANGNVTITVDPAFSTTTYLDPQTNVIDETTNTLGIPFGVDFGATIINRTALTIFPTKMLTVKIQIQNCSVPSNINFTDVTFTDMFSFYTLIANDPITAGVSYNNTQYIGNITDNTCDPIITSFTNNIASGVGNILTITGKYFGDAKIDNARVMFRNANNGLNGGSYPPNGGPNAGGIQDYDKISWTDNEIKIKLPSIIDSITDPITLSSVKVTPGSGKFKVRNRYNYETETQQKLLIPYGIAQAITSVTLPYGKHTVELSGSGGNNGYTFHMHPDVETTFPGAKAIIKKALKDWRCASGINWHLGNDTNLTLLNDTINMIVLYTGGGVNDPAQQAVLSVNTCFSGQTVHGAFMKNFDIKIDQTINWQMDSTGILHVGKEDFYHAFAHELGHAHTLKHSLDTITNDTLQGIMFSHILAGEVPALQRKTVFNSPRAIDGAQFVTTNNLSGTPCAGTHSLVVENCTAISVLEHDNANLNINS